MTLVTYPLDDTDYSAEDAALFHATRTSGIFAGEDFTFSITGADNTITLGAGLAWMRLSKFKGAVAALKTETAVDLGLPDSVYPRIDHVVIQYDANQNNTQVVVKNGTAASSPQPPARSTSEALYELHLLQVRREPGAVAITADNVTDLRMNANYCGLMADSVTSVDTTAIEAQVTALIEKLQAKIEEVEDSTYYASKEYVEEAVAASILHFSVVLAAAEWEGDAAPYTQTIALDGILATDCPHYGVVYSGELADKLAQYEAFSVVHDLETADGTLTFTCFEEKPTVDIEIQMEVNR